MNRAARHGATALLLLACDTGSISVPVNENDGVEPRSRLRAKVWSVDGVSLPRWFYDSKRKEDCAFVEGGLSNTGPGPTYWCLPRDSVRHDATGGLALFDDKACRVPLALASPQERTAYVIVRGASSCAEPPRVFRPLPSENRKPWVFDGVKCVQSPVALATHALGDEVPLDSFVSAVETVTELAGSIARLELVGRDGSRQTIGGFDQGRKFAVSVADPGGHGDRRWFPSRLAFEGAGTVLYADAACTQTVPTKVARDAICPLGASFLFDGVCGEGTYYTLGDPVEISTLREKSPLGACIAAYERGVVAYRRGAPFLRTAFIEAEAPESGGGRIRLRGWGDARSAVMWTTFFDTQLAETCTAELASDGETRCLPGESAAVVLWADAACSKPAYEEPLDGCTVRPAPKWVKSEGRVYRVKGPASNLFEKNGNACRAHTPSTEARSFEVEAAELTQFSLVAEVTR